MLKRLPGGEVRNLVSTTPDTAVVFKPAVVQTPAILTILVFLGRLVAGLVRTLLVHPIAVAVLVVPGVIWVRYGWPTAVAAVTIPCSLLFGWALGDQASFTRWVGWRLLAFWRRVWVYRRHWQPVMIVSGLGRHLQGRDYLPRLLRVECDGWVDHVTVRMLSGQAVKDWADRTVKNAGVERPAERPVLTVAEVFALAAAMPPRFRALVLLATFGSLRWGELAALRRHHLDLEARTVRIEASVSEMKTGELITGRPKSDAGVRVVTLPEVIIGDLAWHLQRFSEQGPDGLVFVGEKGAQLRRSNFTKVWAKALAKSGLPKIHIHDLRHTGNTLAAATGATLKELMARMGHSSTKAAMVYLHAAKDRDRAIADAMGEIVKQGLASAGNGDEDQTATEAKIN